VDKDDNVAICGISLRGKVPRIQQRERESVGSELVLEELVEVAGICVAERWLLVEEKLLL